MIEPIMYLAIGFLVSMLFGLMIVPLVHNRAVRLTTRRMEAATPLSMAEIQADKDQLRAEFAAKTESLRTAETALREKQGDLAKLSAELSDRSMMAESRQTELVAVRAQIHELKSRVGNAEKEFGATQARLEKERSESEKATRELSEARDRVDNLS